MTMMFRTVKDSLINNVLGPAEHGRYRTIGYQRQMKAAGEALGDDRMVQVFFHSGDFAKQGGRVNGVTQHDAIFRIELTTASAAEGDLSVINDPNATAAQVAAAMAAFQEAAAVADESIDELFDLIYQVLMDARNIHLGLETKGEVSNRWVQGLQKDNPIPRGEYVVLTGSVQLGCRVAEQILGDEGVINEDYDITVDIVGDDIEKTGVAGTLGG